MPGSSQSLRVLRSDCKSRVKRIFAEILRKKRSGFRQKAPARKERALMPSKRLKSGPAGPMVLHAPSVCEPLRQAQERLRSLPLIKASLRNQVGFFPFGPRIAAVKIDLDSCIRATVCSRRSSSDGSPRLVAMCGG